MGSGIGSLTARKARKGTTMTLETVASQMAKIISRTTDAAKASAPVVAMMVHAVTTTKGDTIDALERLYLQTFEAAPSTKRKAVQSYFTRMRGLMAALVDYGDHPDMMDAIDAELALVEFVDDECRRAEGAKKWPKAPVFTKAADAIRRDEAASTEGSFSHDHADLEEADTVGEALKVLDEAITRHAEIRASLETYRTKIVTDAIGAPTEFEIRGDTNAAPSFSVKALS